MVQGLPRTQALQRLQQLQEADSNSTVPRRVCELFARLCCVVCYSDSLVWAVGDHLGLAGIALPLLLVAVVDDVLIFVSLLTVAPVVIE